MLTQIKKDALTAMREKNTPLLLGLRLLKSDLEYAAKRLKKEELTDDEIMKVIRSRVNKAKEELTYVKDDNQKKELQAVINVYESYLPKDLTKAEVEEMINTTVASVDNFGAAMKILSSEIKGRYDMKEVSSLVKERFK